MNMDLKAVAAQLRKPDGDIGKQVGVKMNEGNLHINRNAIAALNTRNNDNILEIGMGNGFFVKDILSHDPSVKYTGYDFSETMVEESRKINSEFIKSGQARFVLAATDQLPFADEAFDTVFTVNTIYFWTEPNIFLAEIYRVMKPGGKLVIALRPKSTMEHYPFVQYGFKLFDKTDVSKLLVNNRFNVAEIIEAREPDQQLGGQTLRVDTLIVIGAKQ
jgi:ubiquinone/menaquinone biosynthesis C-methylase UbiE